jgi:hypothetical protein
MAQAQKKPLQNKRIDPNFRSTDGARSASIINANPDRKYVLVHKNHPTHGADYYESLGWKVLNPSEDGERLRRASRSEGKSSLEYLGHILMWMPKDEHLQLVQFGEDGTTGQELADKIKKQVINPNSIARDTFRGIRGAPMEIFDHEIKDTQAFDI